MTSGRWRLDPGRSRVEFRVGMLGGLTSTRGHFDSYEGRLDMSAAPAIELTVEAGSLNTGNRRRDRHLRSGTFFDAENHPQVRFVSDSVVPQGDTLNVRGHLSAREHSIPLELGVEVREIDGELEVEAATTAPHRELGMTWSPLGTVSPVSELTVRGYLVPDPQA